MALDDQGKQGFNWGKFQESTGPILLGVLVLLVVIRGVLEVVDAEQAWGIWGTIIAGLLFIASFFRDRLEWLRYFSVLALLQLIVYLAIPEFIEPFVVTYPNLVIAFNALLLILTSAASFRVSALIPLIVICLVGLIGYMGYRWYDTFQSPGKLEAYKKNKLLRKQLQEVEKLQWDVDQVTLESTNLKQYSPGYVCRFSNIKGDFWYTYKGRWDRRKRTLYFDVDKDVIPVKETFLDLLASNDTLWVWARKSEVSCTVQSVALPSAFQVLIDRKPIELKLDGSKHYFDFTIPEGAEVKIEKGWGNWEKFSTARLTINRTTKWFFYKNDKHIDHWINPYRIAYAGGNSEYASIEAHSKDNDSYSSITVFVSVRIFRGVKN